MNVWQKLSKKELHQRVFDAVNSNVNYSDEAVLGVPASYLDPKVFNADAPFLDDAPYMTSMVKNPNHIGCHTIGESEAYFSGTQELEREVIRICAEDILKGEKNAQDGYIAAGGTEANLQALWVFRNYFQKKFQASNEEIAIVCSQDSHYSMNKGSNLLGVDIINVPVNDDTRLVEEQVLTELLQDAVVSGKRYFAIVVNMATTMFGSVDEIDLWVSCLKSLGDKVQYKIHVDGAYGGFIYPFTTSNNALNFKNPEVDSITLDAHKMAQAPYGTGIFLCRKGLIENVLTEEAQYVNGMDLTLIGSRSGANAIAVWMILMTYGPHDWKEKNEILVGRTSIICNKLDELGIEYYRHPQMNIVTIRSEFIPKELVTKYGLVPETHTANNRWCKIVVMDHVTADVIHHFLKDLVASKKTISVSL